MPGCYATGAVGALVQRLEDRGIATDDLWEEAIEASLSFANEPRLIYFLPSIPADQAKRTPGLKGAACPPALTLETARAS